MAHEVTFSIPERELNRSDIEFKVKVDGELFGTLRVSEGSLVWLSRHARKGPRVSWIKFDEMIHAWAEEHEAR